MPVNIDRKNQLHPFYMVYLADDGEVICDHLHPKQLLDIMRALCKIKTIMTVRSVLRSTVKRKTAAA